MSDTQTVTVRILDREYKVGCSAEEKRNLQDAAEMIDQRMQDLKRNAKIVGGEKIAVIAALNIAAEYLKLKDSEAQLSGALADRVASLNNLIGEKLGQEK